VEPSIDPTFNVSPPKPNMLADTKPWRTHVAVPPAVDRRYRHLEIIGQFLGCEQLIGLIHRPMLRQHPVIWLP